MLVLNYGRKDRIDHLAFSPDGRAIVATGQNTVRYWHEIADGARAIEVATPRWPRYAHFIGSGKSLLICTTNLWHVEVATGNVRQLGYLNRYPHFDVSPDGRFVLISENVYDPTSNNVLSCRAADTLNESGAQWETTAPIGRGGYRPHYLAGGTHFVRLESDLNIVTQCHVITYDATTGKSVAKSPQVSGGFSSTAVAPDGSWLIGRHEARVYYVPVANGTAGHIQNDSRKHFTGAAYHPSSRYLALTSNDKTVKLYDTTTWDVARTFTWQLGQMRSITFSPDGTLCAAGSDKGQVVVWDMDV